MLKILNYFLTDSSDFFAMWPKGAIVLVAILGLVVLIGLAVFLGYRTIKERQRYLEERSSYMEGVLSKSEFKANVNLLISKSTNDTPFSLVYIDIDEISQMTNAFGDKAVKNVIEIIGQKILKILPFQVQMGRVSLDKFIILFRTEYSKEEVFRVAEQIKDIMKEPVRISYDTETTATASIAIAYYPVHGQNYNQLLNSLEIGVITCKRQGGDKIVVYSEDLGGEEGQNKLYYEQIKSAIINKEFVLYYQPIVNMENHSFVSAEALLRWNHPKLGVLNPKEFINVMEQSGDIYWVGIWGLELMIEQYTVLRRIISNADFNLSINLSLKQLMNENLASDFQKLLKKYKFPAKNLVIEADEFIIYNKHDVISENMKKLHELGFKIAVDGFAFDYNTLLKLNKLEIDILKLNAAFIEDDNKEILKNFIELLTNYASKNNIEIIVERIENEEQIEYFESQGIHNFQGYYISKPISSEELEKIAKEPDIISALKIAQETRDQEILNQSLETQPVEEAVEPTEEQPVEETPTEENVEQAQDAEKSQPEESLKDKKSKSKNKKDKKQEPVEEPKVEEASLEEQPIEESTEQPAEEVQDAEQAQPEDTPVEEVPVEESQETESIEEAPVEEQPIEESTEQPAEEVQVEPEVEQVPAEEIVEETQDAEEAQPEDTPTEEQPLEEVQDAEEVKSEENQPSEESEEDKNNL